MFCCRCASCSARALLSFATVSMRNACNAQSCKHWDPWLRTPQVVLLCQAALHIKRSSTAAYFRWLGMRAFALHQIV
eukprot:scaffold97350_cov19-Tisochrysis_lutea.AAC.1